MKALRQLLRDGNTAAARDRLRGLLAAPTLAPTERDALGRLLLSRVDAFGPSSGRPVLLAGQCTTSWLRPALATFAWMEGLPFDVRETEYDSVLQSLHGYEGERPSVVVLVPWSERLFASGSASLTERVDAEVGLFLRAHELATGLGAKVLQVGYDTFSAGALGVHLGARDPSGRRAVVRQINAELRSRIPESAFFLDLEEVAATEGRRRFYDARRYFWTKQPFSEDGAVELARHLGAGLRALERGSKKVLVLDLDNTLWGGVVGEVGPLGVELGEGPDGEAYRAFQRAVRAVADRGVVLAVASKNNAADAREPFEKNAAMELRLDHFAAFEAHWGPKSESMRRIAETLSLGMDSFVFFDDNPAEREEVRQNAPGVTVVDVPADPAEYERALADALAFESLPLTSADRERTEQYRAEGARRALRDTATNLDDYLRSLEMICAARSFDEGDLPRVVQLLSKTNQFNLTTRRHSRAEVERLVGTPRAFGRTFRLRDRFGDHGLVGVVIAVPNEDDDALRVDTFLMSCRVIARGMEQLMAELVHGEARRLGYRRVRAEYLRTAKNDLVARFFDTLGYRRSKDTPEHVVYEGDLDALPRQAPFIAFEA